MLAVVIAAGAWFSVAGFISKWKSGQRSAQKNGHFPYSSIMVSGTCRGRLDLLERPSADNGGGAQAAELRTGSGRSGPSGKIVMSVAPGLVGRYRLNAIATDASSGRGHGRNRRSGKVEAGTHKLSAVDPLVPVYGNVGGHFPLSAGRGHHLLLRFHANDLGTAAFDREPLTLTPRGLVFNRYDAEIRFIRVRP
jgi:hypothetical protein